MLGCRVIKPWLDIMALSGMYSVRLCSCVLTVGFIVAQPCLEFRVQGCTGEKGIGCRDDLGVSGL